jgi:hypothetical protein
VADGAWSVGGCGRNDVWYYGYPNQGAYYWTQRFGMYWVGGVYHQRYAQSGYECGGLGAPVKDVGFLSEFGRQGQWFEGGAITDDGVIRWGNSGQSAGR